MKLADLQIGVPVLVKGISGNLYEIIRTDITSKITRYLLNGWEVEFTVDPYIVQPFLHIVDRPLDEDAAECGIVLVSGDYSLNEIRKSIQNRFDTISLPRVVIEEVSQNVVCNCDFTTQILPYGCKCGGK